MSSIIELIIEKFCHIYFSHFPNFCYSIMVGTYAIEHRPILGLY